MTQAAIEIAWSYYRSWYCILRSSYYKHRALYCAYPEPFILDRTVKTQFNVKRQLGAICIHKNIRILQFMLNFKQIENCHRKCWFKFVFWTNPCTFVVSQYQPTKYIYWPKLKVLQPIARVKSQNHTWALRWNFTAVKFDWKMSKLSNIQPNFSYCLNFFPPKTKFIFFCSPWRYSRVPCYYFVPWHMKLRWYSRYVEQGACDMAMVKRLHSKTRSTIWLLLYRKLVAYTWFYLCLLNHDRTDFQEINLRAIHSLLLLMMNVPKI